MMKRIAYSLALLLLPSILFGQTVRRDLPNLEFSRFDRNRITFRGDSSAFETLFSKLDRVLFNGSDNLNRLTSRMASFMLIPSILGLISLAKAILESKSFST